MNKYGEASPMTILTLLEETASDHCYSINHSLYDLINQDIGWVLLSGFMQIDRYPRHKENITIRTWLSDYSTIRGIRENVIYDGHGSIIGRAKGQWLFFDIKRKRPVRIFDAIKEQWSVHKEECTTYDITQKIEVANAADYTKNFHVSRFDIDMNQHVNNIRYLQWLMESVPEETYENCYLHSVDGRFIMEAQYGDTITSVTGRDNNDNSFVHAIKVLNNKQVCATAKTIWKSRL